MKNKQYRMTVYYSRQRVEKIIAKHLGFNQKGFKFVELVSIDKKSKILNYTFKGVSFSQICTDDLIDLIQQYIES
jgi:hypothetical protein